MRAKLAKINEIFKIRDTERIICMNCFYSAQIGWVKKSNLVEKRSNVF